MNAPAPLIEASDAAAIESSFVVEGMHCAGCIARIEGALGKLDGVSAARVNFGAHTVRVRHLPAVAPDQIEATVKALGFDVHPASAQEDETVRDESRDLMKAMAVAGFAAMNVMLLSVGVWAGAEGPTRDLFHWVSALIALPAIAYAGRPFFKSAWRVLRAGHTNMDVPISIGVVLTTAMSLYETATGGAHAYFDGAVMLLFFLLAGRFLDSVMRAKAQDGVAALLRRVPQEVQVLRPDGSTENRLAAEIAPKMRVLIAAGERIGIDGVVENGRSHVDRALVTGESAPEHVMPGDAVLAGTINLDAPLTVRVTAVGTQTVIAEIARLMDSAGQSKSRYVRIADRASRLYAPAVHSLALLSCVGWLLAGAGVHQSLMIAVAVLIITCPCALGLAVPISQVVAAGALMRAGVLIKDGSALERLANADAALFDKTGTITLARLVPMNGLPDDPAERAALLALARASRHPLSLAIKAVMNGEAAAIATDISEQPGLGVQAMVAGETARLGRADWIGADAAGGEVATVFRLGTRPARVIRFQDSVRSDAVEAMARMKALGFAPHMLSGDAEEPVRTLARQLGIEASSRLSPADKFAVIDDLTSHGHRVLMVGDGLNDGPALKRAYVAMAPATASDVGQLAADLVFFGDRLGQVPLAIIAARRTMAVVRQNFALAICYNLLAVPLAIGGLVTPLVAALAMSGSSLIVVANALRLRGCAK